MDILIIQTGGTIDKCYPRRKSGYAFEFKDSYAKIFIEKFVTSYNLKFQIIQPFIKDSLEITDEDREKLVNTLVDNSCEKVLITHGTDTIIETARYLTNRQSSFIRRCIVMTGSYVPGAFKETDADFNIAFALGGLCMSKEPGIFVAMQGRFHKPYEVERNQLNGDFFSTQHKK